MEMNIERERIRMRTLAEMIQESNYTVVFTGAGMSTESGLPDFRSAKGGLWEKFNPEELANVHALENNEAAFLAFYQSRLADVKAFAPHQGHHVLASWEKKNRIQGIITQNVDGFHHDAGNTKVMELHGTFRKLYCHHCGQAFQQDDYVQGTVHCTCGGPIRPGIVLFGEMLPEDAFRQAEKAALKAELFIVLGSSLTVTPANMFPVLAKENGAKLVIVNHDATPLDRMADLVIQDQQIGELLTAVDQAL